MQQSNASGNQWPTRLQKWRGKMSQEQAARRLGVSNSAYRRWEQGTAQPRGLYAQLVETAIERAAQEAM